MGIPWIQHLTARLRGPKIARDYVRRTSGRVVSRFASYRGSDGRRLLFIVHFRDGRWPERAPRAYVAVDPLSGAVEELNHHGFSRVRGGPFRSPWGCL